MGLVARALRDPKLYEQSILVHSPKPNGLQANDIAEQYLVCGDGAGALRCAGLAHTAGKGSSLNASS